MRPSEHLFDDLPDPDAEVDPDLEAELDEDFPLGDGTAETEALVVCPYCGEENEIALDPGSGPRRATWRTARCAATPGW